MARCGIVAARGFRAQLKTVPARSIFTVTATRTTPSTPSSLLRSRILNTHSFAVTVSRTMNRTHAAPPDSPGFDFIRTARGPDTCRRFTLLDYAQIQQVFGFHRQSQNEWKFPPNSVPFKRLTEGASVIIAKDLRGLLNDSDLHASADALKHGILSVIDPHVLVEQLTGRDGERALFDLMTHTDCSQNQQLFSTKTPYRYTIPRTKHLRQKPSPIWQAFSPQSRT
jgi:hypothetical protein